jgi:putative molybdopterin biosynthesis protein
MAIENVAQLYGLDFLPVADEHYDFFVSDSRRDRPGVQAFLKALGSAEARALLIELGFTPSNPAQ